MIIATKTILLLLILPVLVVLLQIFLSKRGRAWPGLILPGMCALYSFFILLNFAVDTGMGAVGVAANMIFTFLIFNIPTAVLAAIYAVCREKYRRQKQLDKMQIQDLDS